MTEIVYLLIGSTRTGQDTFLIKYGKDTLILSDNIVAFFVAREATYDRQSEEWCMRAVQRYFPRLSDRISMAKKRRRRLILLFFVLLLNYITCLIGPNKHFKTCMNCMQ